jgi:uncharacterized membrane protein
MITHNNFDYFITYILFSFIGHEEVLLQFQQTLLPSLGAHCIAIVVRTAFSSVFINQTSLSFEFKRLKLGQLFAISLSRK